MIGSMVSVWADSWSNSKSGRAAETVAESKAFVDDLNPLPPGETEDAGREIGRR
jgi:hypothetical protein